MASSHCLQFAQKGPPASVLRIAAQDIRPPDGHEVRVRMKFAPVNPADLNFIEGHYGKIPNLPAIPGVEGVGIVEAAGPTVSSLEKGDLVIPLAGIGTWAQHLTAPEHQFARLPAGLDPVQASMLRINPLTAWRLLKGFLPLEQGDVIAQNAANSGVGRSLIQVARHLGIRTVNFVRRAELVAELKALGADFVFLDSEEGLAEAKAVMKSFPLRLAANAVSGDSAVRLMDLLSPEGTLVTYGAMSRQALKVPNKFLIFKNLDLRGLWITRWIEHAGTAELFDALHPLAEMMRRGELRLAVEEVVPVKDFHRAIERASQDRRDGKIVLDLSQW